MGLKPCFFAAFATSRRLGAHRRLYGSWCQTARFYSNGAPREKHCQAVYLASADNVPEHHTPLVLGLVNYFERHMPFVGFFKPIGNVESERRHTLLVKQALRWQEDEAEMVGVPEEEATKLITSGRSSELLDRIYANYAAYREKHELVVIEGTGVGGTELDGHIAAALNAPVLMVTGGQQRQTASQIYNQAMLKRNVLADSKVDVMAVIADRVPRRSHTLVNNQLRSKFAEAGVPYAGAIPEDPLLESVRLDEVRAALGADVILGSQLQLDMEFDSIMVACQRVEELLEALDEAPGSRPLVITSADRTDIILALLAAQVSVQGPSVAGVLLTSAGHQRAARSYSRAIAGRIFEGIERSKLYSGALLPVLSVEKPLYEALQNINSLQASILPTSQRKIQQSKMLFDRYIDADVLVKGLDKPQTQRMTPKMFMHNIKTMALNNPQTIVLPEATDKRILNAAAVVTERALARVVLLGDPEIIKAEAKKLGLDISKAKIINPKESDRLDQYVERLVQMRQKKGMTHETATDILTGDPNFFGVMMVQAGDADGMVSGATHTTAATIRPALQVLKSGTLVSSIFFMCLPDKVLVYGDCAVNVNPNASELAQIAITSADTAKAFGIEPRVAMLSYSTLGSGAGPDVNKVIEATQLVKQQRPDLKVEGPIQYDAAIDPTVAAAKVKGKSEVAGRATVFIFPDLNTGNNTYKAVQQASGAIAMGPVMQGLLKPVNDLSRGCTVPDITNTICVTSVQAMQVKKQLEAQMQAGRTAAATSASTAAAAA